MAKVIFEFTESDAVSMSQPGQISVPVMIGVSIDGLNEEKPGHAECLALIMKKASAAIIQSVNEVYMERLKDSDLSVVNSELFEIKAKNGDKNVH